MFWMKGWSSTKPRMEKKRINPSSKIYPRRAINCSCRSTQPHQMWLQNDMQISDVYVQQGRAFLYRVLPMQRRRKLPNPFNVQHETSESDESCFECFDEWLYILYLSKLIFEKKNKYGNHGHREGGKGVQWPRGPWTLEGQWGSPWALGRPLASEGPWAREGPIEMTLRNQHVRPEDLFFWDQIILRTKLQHFLRLFWCSQNRKSVLSWPRAHLRLSAPLIATAIVDDNYDPQSLFDNKIYFYDFASCASESATKTRWEFASKPSERSTHS